MRAFAAPGSLAVVVAACAGPPCPNCPATPSAANAAISAPAAGSAPNAAGAAQAASPAGERETIAVLPLDDDELLRAERAELRSLLASELGRKLPAYAIVPLANVDEKLVVRPKRGEHCAYAHGAALRRATREGWFTTRITHILGVNSKPEELWVDVAGTARVAEVFLGPWDPKLSRVERYRTAFKALVSHPDEIGGLGVLMGTFVQPGWVTVGALALCEGGSLDRCAPETKLFADRAPAFVSCFSGVDEASENLVFEAGGACEIANLDHADGPDGARERCLCAALASSAGRAAEPGRRSLALSFEAPDIKGKPRPEIALLDATENLGPDAEWQTVRRTNDGKPTNVSIRRLSIENLDAARAPLARCSVPPGTVVVAELHPSSAGNVDQARIVAGALSKPSAACIERELARVRWPCTDDGKSASLRIALRWPD